MQKKTIYISVFSFMFRLGIFVPADDCYDYLFFQLLENRPGLGRVFNTLVRKVI